MSDLPLSLDSLLDYVRTRDAAGPLDRVAEAVELAAKLGRYGDHLVNFFIDEARTAGESWAAIGERLGLSRQAVQKRYASQSGQISAAANAFFDKFVNDAKRVIVHAQEEARRRGVGYIGTEHLLLGLADEPECTGARSLARCGAGAEVVTAAVNGRVGVPSGEPRTDKLPFTLNGKSVFDHALRESVRLGHDYVGTGHLALGCRTVSGGMAAEILGNLGVSYEALRQAVADLAPADPPLRA
jgi:Clp amino terminal domain, pathogenicity island component